jgi:ubiquinone biosynthesis monooxygenase Coq7
MGKEAAMACTVAVEEVIVEHYNSQLRTLHERPDSKNEDGLRQVEC